MLALEFAGHVCGKAKEERLLKVCASGLLELQNYLFIYSRLNTFFFSFILAMFVFWPAALALLMHAEILSD